MSYTRNFGFRAFENAIRNGRHRVPKDANTKADSSGENGFLIGAAAKVDSADPGFLAIAGGAAGSAEVPTQVAGIVLYEHIQYKDVDTFLTTPQDSPFHLAPQGQYAQLVHGMGVKVWFRNLGDKTLYDGRTQTNVSPLSDPTTLPSVGDELTPDVDGRWRPVDTGGGDSADSGWLIVEQVNTSTGVVECRLTF